MFPGNDSNSLDDLLKNSGVTNQGSPYQISSGSSKDDMSHSQSDSDVNRHATKIACAEDELDENSKPFSRSGVSTIISDVTESESGKPSNGKRKMISNNSGIDEALALSNERPSKVMKKTLRRIPFDRVIFIDSTWNQASNIVSDERLKGNASIVSKKKIKLINL